MNDIAALTLRAARATQVAARVIIARVHLDNALAGAVSSHLDIAVVDDLNKALAVVDRTIKHAEQCRLRLLRKADRKEQARA